MDLAIFTGKPYFDSPQHVGGPIVEDETRRRFYNLTDFAFDRNHLSNNGPLAQNLEEQVAARHNVAEAALVANATLAQMLLMKAMGLTSGEALVAANTFVATPHVCEWLGMRPVFCDINPETLNLDPADAERKITPLTRVIIPTHVFGVISDMPALSALAEAHGLALIADAAHAFDCDARGVFPGGFGAPETISFHATKFFSTLEGGAILTNDPALAAELRSLRNFGYSRPHVAAGLGINAKVSEISAAFGLASLPALEDRKRLLKKVRDVYTTEFHGVPGVMIHPLNLNGENNYRYFAVFIGDDFGMDRDLLRRVLEHENVIARTYFHPGCHRLEYYRERYPDMLDSLPNIDRTLGRILCLPTSSPDLDARTVARDVARLVITARERAGDIKAWWDKVSKETL